MRRKLTDLKFSRISDAEPRKPFSDGGVYGADCASEHYRQVWLSMRCDGNDDRSPMMMTDTVALAACAASTSPVTPAPNASWPYMIW